jgi:hypothetical protein
VNLAQGWSMDTFTLVVILWLAPDEPWGWGDREARTPGLGLAECMAAAKLVKPPQGRARCYIEGRPEPIRQTDNDYTLNVHEYVGGGRLENDALPQFEQKRLSDVGGRSEAGRGLRLLRPRQLALPRLPDHQGTDQERGTRAIVMLPSCLVRPVQ